MAFPTGYTKYQEVTIDHTKVPSTLTNFTVLINLANLSVGGADIFDSCRSDGGDIRVTLSDGTTECAVDVASINTTSKTGELWVKVPSLSNTVDTVLRIWYNGVDSKPADNSTYGKNNAWDANSIVIHHMNGAAASSAKYSNSKNNAANALDEVNAPSSAVGAFGEADGAYQCQSSGSKALLISSPPGPGYDDGWQLSAWVKPNGGSHNTIAYARNIENGYGAFIAGGGASINAPAGSGSFGGYFLAASSPNCDIGTWYHIVIQHNGASGKIYQNGVSLTLDPGSPKNNITVPGVAIEIGRQLGASYSDMYIDEWRMCDTHRSADWITTEYNNQSSPATFYSVGTEQGGGGAGPSPAGRDTILRRFQGHRRGAAVIWSVITISLMIAVPTIGALWSKANANGSDIVEVRERVATTEAQITALIENQKEFREDQKEIKSDVKSILQKIK